MHLTKLANSRSSAACRAWHTGKGCLNDCFHLPMQRLSNVWIFLFFLKKAGTLIVRKISRKNIPLCKILIWVIQKVLRKKKVCFWHMSCVLKVNSNLSSALFCYSVWHDCLVYVNKKLSLWHCDSFPLYNRWQILSVVNFMTFGTT